MLKITLIKLIKSLKIVIISNIKVDNDGESNKKIWKWLFYKNLTIRVVNNLIFYFRITFT